MQSGLYSPALCSGPISASLVSDVLEPRGLSPVRTLFFPSALFSPSKPRAPLRHEKPWEAAAVVETWANSKNASSE